jgi:hypothetical protein
MDNKDKIDKSIIDKIMSIAGVEMCAISSLDGEVLLFNSATGEISDTDIKLVSSEISRLFASYSISSIDISSLYLNFESHNIILHGFGSGFIFIASSKSSNINLLKMETSYLESEFIKIVNQSFGGASSKSSLFQGKNESENISSAQNIEHIFPYFGDISGEKIYEPEPAKPKIVPLNIISAIKDQLSDYLGPISPMIFMSKLDLIGQDEKNLSIDKMDGFIKLLAEEIEGQNDKRAFIAAAKALIKNI